MTKSYGDKRDYPKIDIYAKTFNGIRHVKAGKYLCTTTWSKTCRDAVERYIERNPTTGYAGSDLYARFQ